MDNRQEKQEDVYEAYVDASVALFMQYYCDILDEGIANSDDLSAEGERIAFPEDLDKRCRSLIKRTVKRQKIRQAMRYAGKAFRSVCRVAVACLALMSLLFVTVEAVRVPIISYFIEHSENNFFEYGTYDSSGEAGTDEILDLTDPLRGIIPEEYQLTMQEGTSLSNFSAIYSDSNNNSIYILAQPINSISGIDLEGTDSTQEFYIYNRDAILVTEDDITRLMIIDEEHAATFTVILSGDPDLDAIEIADEFLRIIS